MKIPYLLFVAAQIANIIDTTSESFGIERTISNILVDPFVYVEDDFDVADELVRLCEDNYVTLMYLVQL